MKEKKNKETSESISQSTHLYSDRNATQRLIDEATIIYEQKVQANPQWGTRGKEMAWNEAMRQAEKKVGKEALDHNTHAKHKEAVRKKYAKYDENPL